MRSGAAAERVEDAVREQSQRTIAAGARLLTIFALVSTGLSVGLAVVGDADNQLAPTVFAGSGVLVAVLLWWAARARRLHGRMALAAVIVVALFPSAFLAGAEWGTVTGAAPLLLGPPVLIYLVLILFSGFFLNPAFSVVAGVVSAAGYLGVFAWVHPRFAALTLPDSVWQQELTDPRIFVVRALVMVITGVGMAFLARFARGLIVLVLEQEREVHEVRSIFGSYVSDAVAAKVLRERGALRGERKHVAVLFCDIRGFTALSEELDPELLVAKLNTYLDVMVRCISARGGVVDKFIGDAVMGVFGGLLALDDPCGAALLAAQDMRAALTEVDAALNNGIGLHWGDVIQGAIGSEVRREFTIIGDAVNVASRLEGLTRTYECGILASGPFVDQLPPATRRSLRSLGAVEVKGRRSAVEIFVADDPPGAPAASSSSSSP